MPTLVGNRVFLTSKDLHHRHSLPEHSHKQKPGVDDELADSSESVAPLGRTVHCFVEEVQSIVQPVVYALGDVDLLRYSYQHTCRANLHMRNTDSMMRTNRDL